MNDEDFKEQLSWNLHSLANSVKDWDEKTLKEVKAGMSFHKQCLLNDWSHYPIGSLPDPNPDYQMIRMELKIR